MLARVGNRAILPDDFKNRTSLTVLPKNLPARRGYEKNLILNSLIAEKLLALEAEKDTSITRHHKLNQYVQGIKEQKMREIHFQRSALEKAIPPEAIVEAAANAAGRQYELSYFDLPAAVNADSVMFAMAGESDGFEKSFERFYPDQKLARQTVLWHDVLNAPLFDALYMNRAEPGQMIGPVAREDGRVFFFRVEAWKSSVALSEAERQIVREQVTGRLRRQMALESYDGIIGDLMAGKQLEFDREGLIYLANLLGPIYLGNQSQFRFDVLMDPMQRWKQEVRLDSLRQTSPQWEQHPVLRIDNSTWSLGDLFLAIERHPLVFHQKRFPKHEFGNQIKLALKDLLRDHFINQQCYQLGYDELPAVKQTEQLWRDYFYSVLQRSKMSAGWSVSGADALEQMDREVRELRRLYSGKIKINAGLLSEIELPEVQFFALQQNVPFPVVSPAFQVLSLDDQLQE